MKSQARNVIDQPGLKFEFKSETLVLEEQLLVQTHLRSIIT